MVIFSADFVWMVELCLKGCVGNNSTGIAVGNIVGRSCSFGIISGGGGGRSLLKNLTTPASFEIAVLPLPLFLLVLHDNHYHNHDYHYNG